MNELFFKLGVVLGDLKERCFVVVQLLFEGDELVGLLDDFGQELFWLLVLDAGPWRVQMLVLGWDQVMIESLDVTVRGQKFSQIM